MNILITGISGFVGRHLAEYLHRTQSDHTLYGTVYQVSPASMPDYLNLTPLDLCDESAIHDLIQKIQPDHVYHLAAQSSPSLSFKQPWETLRNNIRAQLNLLNACLSLDTAPRILIVSSAEIYGYVQPDEIPLTESTPLRPTSPYSLSKVTQDMMGLQYFLSHQLPIIRARAFNHIGPGQSERFVAPAFATQVARIEAGLQEPFMKVGNLSARRDFTDVRDVVRAYHALMMMGTPGEACNIASNQAYSIQHILDILLNSTESRIDVQVDPARLRPVDVPVIRGDYSKLHQATGWQPQIDFTTTVHDILDDCRQRVQQTLRS